MDPYTRSLLDRAEPFRRSTAEIADLWGRPEARVLVVDPEGEVAATADGGIRTEPPREEFDPELHYLLGLVDGNPVFARSGDPGPTRVSLRQTLTVGQGAELDIVTTAVAICHWHRLEPRCTNCGGQTEVRMGGFQRHCLACGRTWFPRQDPAVIVAILDDADRILLGHHVNWGPGRVSVLAGFVEAGESLEQAVHREMAEEAGVALSRVSYFGSQPWPFPRSLMVGFFARATSAEIQVDGEEIQYARWFTPDELSAAVSTHEIGLPGEASIAHRMVRSWSEGCLPAGL